MAEVVVRSKRKAVEKCAYRAITLMEIMIVIVLIGLIGGVLSYNMRGSLGKGKMFATEQRGARIYQVLCLKMAAGWDAKDVADNWREILHTSPIENQGKKARYDGWGQEYHVEANAEGTDVLVWSEQFSELFRQENPNFSEDQYCFR